MSGSFFSSRRSPWLDYAIKVLMAALLIAFTIAILANLDHLWSVISASTAYLAYALNLLLVTPVSGIYAALAGKMTFWPALGGSAILACVSVYFLCLQARHKIQPFMSQRAWRLAVSLPRILIWPELGFSIIMLSDLIDRTDGATAAQGISAAVMILVLFFQIFGTSESIARRVERLSSARSRTAG
ncbi:MAG TPA: hypothetical protein VFN77_10065 [Acetobacteraceae bacterium]|nr:hypothetical protein [Acetobacteraceae bacterium]